MAGAVKRAIFLDLGLLGLVVALVAVAGGPAGNFPLNDDWSYGLTVRELLEHGAFRPDDWTAMPLFSHTLWGALFCLPAGFSFTALRLSTMVAAFLGAAALYLAVGVAGRSRAAAIVLALAATFNPLAWPLTLTYMTDVSFVAMASAAMLLLIGHLRGGSDRLLFAGTALASLAILCRHIGLALPVAFSVTAVAFSGGRRGRLWRALVPGVVGVATLLVFDHVMRAAGVMPEIYGSRPSLWHSLLVQPGIVPKRVIANLLIIVLYVGLFYLPLLVLTPLPGPQRRPRRLPGSRALWVSLGILTAGLFLYHRDWMPLGRSSIFLESGAGPLTLRDTFELQLEHVAPLPKWFWMGVTAASIVGGALLLERVAAVVRTLFRRLREHDLRPETAIVVFCLATAVAHMIPLVILGFFDRYLLPLLAPIGLLLIPPLSGGEPRRGRRWPAFLLLALMAGYSLASAHDYLAWNRARWQLLDDWTGHRGLTTAQVDGGFEFHGLRRDPADSTVPVEGKSWWWVRDDLYLVAFGPLPGYEIADRATYRRWLTGKRESVLLLRRNGPPPPG